MVQFHKHYQLHCTEVTQQTHLEFAGSLAAVFDWWGASDASASDDGQAYIGGWLSDRPEPIKSEVWWFHYPVLEKRPPLGFQGSDTGGLRPGNAWDPRPHAAALPKELFSEAYKGPFGDLPTPFLAGGYQAIWSKDRGPDPEVESGCRKLHTATRNGPGVSVFAVLEIASLVFVLSRFVGVLLMDCMMINHHLTTIWENACVFFIFPSILCKSLFSFRDH